MIYNRYESMHQKISMRRVHSYIQLYLLICKYMQCIAMLHLYGMCEVINFMYCYLPNSYRKNLIRKKVTNKYFQLYYAEILVLKRKDYMQPV